MTRFFMSPLDTPHRPKQRAARRLGVTYWGVGVTYWAGGRGGAHVMSSIVET